VSLRQQGTRLESDRGGRAVGELVHAALAVIPLDRPDLAEPFVRYFAQQRRLTGGVVRRATALVQAALRSGEIRAVARARSWREVPFAAAEGDGFMEGAIDLLAEGEGAITLADFKTDAVGAGQAEDLRRLYRPQLAAYADALRRAGITRVVERLILLSERGAETVDAG
jgi:ATP-dependent exoDNAse (exonuclease V) beta subunit